MKDKLYIQTKLGNLIHRFIPQSTEAKAIYDEEINIVSWCFNEGNLRTQKEMDIAIKNAKEELIGFEFANDESYHKRVVQARLKQLLDINE